jgi:hypothetical protein
MTFAAKGINKYNTGTYSFRLTKIVRLEKFRKVVIG